MITDVLSILKWICIIVLSFYIIRVILLVFFGKSNHDNHRLRGSMALIYAVFAAYFIYKSIVFIPFLVNSIVGGISLGNIKYSWLILLLYITIGTVFTAFLCNFSRSLWMLKSLENGIFEAVPDWNDLTKPISKRFIEFFIRSIAAFLFILLEFEFEKISHYSLVDDIKILNSNSIPEYNISSIGVLGIYLYSSLLLWWCAGFWIAKRRMPIVQLIFYFAGIIISIFVKLYGNSIITDETVIIILISLVLAIGASSFMLFIVFKDIYLGVITLFNLFTAEIRTIRQPDGI